MEQYIKKSALVAKIEKIREYANENWDVEEVKGIDKFIDKLESYINTLEVKEVDLEAELNKWRHNHFHGRRDKDASGEYLERISQLELAKHFFELGIKAKDK